MKKFVFSSLTLLLFISLGYVYLSSDDPSVSLNDNDVAPIEAVELPEQLQQILKIVDDLQRQQQLDTLFNYWMKFDPLDAIASIQDLSDADQISESYNAALLSWSNLDNAEFETWLAVQKPNSDLDMALISLIQSVGTDYSQAILYAEKISSSLKQELALKALLPKWVEASPGQATDWVLSSLDSSEQWLIFLFETLTQTNPELAISTLSAFANTSDAQITLTIETIVANLNLEQLSPDLIIAIKTMAPYAIREEFIAALIPALFKGKKSSLEEIESLISSLLPGRFRDELSFALALNWSFVDPLVSSKYAESLTGEARDHALDAVVRVWLSDDLAAANEWLKTVEGNVDLAAGSLSRGSAGQGNLSIADKWSKRMEDVEARTEVVYDVFQNMYNRNPLVGTSYVIENPLLSREQKMEWLTEAGPNRFYANPAEAFAEYEQAEADDIADAAAGLEIEE